MRQSPSTRSPRAKLAALHPGRPNGAMTRRSFPSARTHISRITCLTRRTMSNRLFRSAQAAGRGKHRRCNAVDLAAAGEGCLENFTFHLLERRSHEKAFPEGMDLYRRMYAPSVTSLCYYM